MAHSFKSNSGIKSFGVFKEPQSGGDYINKKKTKAICFKGPVNHPLIKFDSESDLLLFKIANKLMDYPFLNSNKANLNIKLISKLDLKDVPVIQDLSNNDEYVIPDLSNKYVPVIPDFASKYVPHSI